MLSRRMISGNQSDLDLQRSLINNVVRLGELQQRYYETQNNLETNEKECRGIQTIHEDCSYAMEYNGKAWIRLITRLDRYNRNLEHVHNILSERSRLTSKDATEELDPDTRFINRLTYLGGIFLPFSLLAGVFSMADDFLPGKPKFWVFWVAGIVLLVLVIGLIYLDILKEIQSQRRRRRGGLVPLYGTGWMPYIPYTTPGGRTNGYYEDHAPPPSNGDSDPLAGSLSVRRYVVLPPKLMF